MTENIEKEQKASYQIGTRVILAKLKKSKHLNGKHGTIASNIEDGARYRFRHNVITS